MTARPVPDSTARTVAAGTRRFVAARPGRRFETGKWALPRLRCRRFHEGMSDISVHVHQCPFCELRFGSVNEVRDHVITDHPAHAAAFEAAAPSEHS
jgi:hypothetical protein